MGVLHPHRKMLWKAWIFQAVLGIPISMLHKYEGIITNKIKPQLQKYAGFVPKNMLPTLQINNASFINGKEKTDA